VGAQSAIAERCGRLPSLFEIPLALSMLAVGGPAGGAAALLFAGPATNLPSLIVIGRYSSWKVAASLAVLVWGIRSSRRSLAPLGLKMDCTLEMRQPRWAHFAGKGLQSEAKAILTEVPVDGC